MKEPSSTPKSPSGLVVLYLKPMMSELDRRLLKFPVPDDSNDLGQAELAKAKDWAKLKCGGEEGENSVAVENLTRFSICEMIYEYVRPGSNYRDSHVFPRATFLPAQLSALRA